MSIFHVVAFLAGGALSGFLSGFIGIGGGMINIPVMLYLGVPVHTVMGTSLAIIIPTALAGGIQHAFMNNIDWKIWALMAGTAVAGSIFGARMMEGVSPALLKKICGIILLIVSIQIIFSKAQ